MKCLELTVPTYYFLESPLPLAGRNPARKQHPSPADNSQADGQPQLLTTPLLKCPSASHLSGPGCRTHPAETSSLCSTSAKPREESEVLNTATNNPILKNATFPNHVQLKALKALKKVRGYLADDSHRIQHSTCHVLPQGKMTLGELQLIQTVQGT